jgi:hypothetical protein
MAEIGHRFKKNRRMTMYLNRFQIFGVLVCGLLLAAVPAGAKCTVTLKFTNNDTHEVTVLGNDSQARVNGGTYSKMDFQDVVLAPGATGTTSWTTNMSCGGHAKRDLASTGNNDKYEKMVANVDIDDGVTYGPSALKND